MQLIRHSLPLLVGVRLAYHVCQEIEFAKPENQKSKTSIRYPRFDLMSWPLIAYAAGNHHMPSHFTNLSLLKFPYLQPQS
jgi:hypothetical protein